MNCAVRLFILSLVVTLIRAEHLEDSHGYEREYASSYDNYEPHDYQFDYSVSDPHTGDHKSQYEVKQNGVVRGFYSLVEPDGTTRVVEYIADEHGFRADVKKIGHAVHDTPTPIVSDHHNLYEEGYKGVYDGQGHNYEGIVLQHPEQHRFTEAIISAEEAKEEEEGKVIEPISYLNHESLQPETVHAPLIYISKPHVHVTSEVHGLTGNSNDDSSYTNYGDDEEKREEWTGGFHHPGRPEIYSWAPIPYKTFSHYIQPISYQTYNHQPHY